MAKSKSTKIVSKKHLARLERERRQARAITIGSVVILAIIFLSILYGVLNDTVFNNYRTILTVNDEKITAREFEARIKTAREQLIDQYMYYYQMAMMFGMDPSSDSSLMQVFTNIQNQLDYPELLANQVLISTENDLLIRQYGQANGINITAAEVEESIWSTYGFFPEGTQTPTPTITLFSYSTLSASQLDLVTATPTKGQAFTPTTTGPTAISVTATPVPSATPMTAEGFTSLYADALVHYRTLGFSEKMFRTIFFENALYRERVKAMVTADIPHEADKVWARQIVVADQATAETVYVLLRAGGDFTTLAAAYSTDATKDTGGDLGWFAEGIQAAEVDAVVFDMEIGAISEPVQTPAGFHILQVIGHENRPLTTQEYATAVDDAFNAWLEEQRTAATIEVNPDFMNYVPTEPTLQQAFTDMFATETAVAPTQIAKQATYEAELALTPSATPLPPTATSQP